MKNAALTFKSKIYKLEHLVGMHYIEVPKKKVEELGGKFNVRLVCKINDTLMFQCGIVALGGGKAYISINATRMKKAKLKVGDTVIVILKKDPSKYGMEMSEELKELLIQDVDGRKRFAGLIAGKQRYIIFYVQQVRSPHLRLKRALMLINNLKKTKPGKESFREILGMDKP